jgi:hypothetical protein
MLTQMNEGPLVVKVATPSHGTRRSDWPNPYYQGSLSGPAFAPATGGLHITTYLDLQVFAIFSACLVATDVVRYFLAPPAAPKMDMTIHGYHHCRHKAKSIQIPRLYKLIYIMPSDLGIGSSM